MSNVTSDNVYLGSVVFTEIPPASDGEKELYAKAKFEKTDNAPKADDNGTDVVTVDDSANRGSNSGPSTSAGSGGHGSDDGGSGHGGGSDD